MSPEETVMKILVVKGSPYILKPNDWLELRKTHGIFGFFDGARSESALTQPLLPLKLSMYEAKYLVKYGIAQTFEVPELLEMKIKVDEKEFTLRRERSYLEQVKQHKEQRRVLIESMVDKIIEGKLRKGRCVVPDKEAVIEDELAKITTLPFENVDIDLLDPWLSESSYIPYSLPEFTTTLDKLRYRVFEDFHHNLKYFLTTGYKFGGDFIAYKGDPVFYHADYIIICEDPERKFSDVYLRSQSRLAATVNKKLLVAYIVNSELRYKLVSRPKLTVEEEEEASHTDDEDL